MDIKQKFNSKLKSLVKVPSNLTSNVTPPKFKATNFQNINPFKQSRETKPGLTDSNALSPENIKYIQENHLPIVTQYTKQKELREIQTNPYLTNPKLEQEIINSIEQIYYSDLLSDDCDLKDDEPALNDEPPNENSSKQSSEAFDPFEHILNKLPDTMDLGFILEEKKKLNKQLMVVTKRVSDLIQQNQKTYNKEMDSVNELQQILTDAINICSSGRSRLDTAKKNLTYPNLKIISDYRRRGILISLLKEFYTIKTLLQTELTLNDLIMEDEDYVRAIKLCLECLNIISTLNHYKCVTDLGAKLHYTIEMTEERLDLTLARLCVNFNANQFNKIRETFALLNKTQFLYDQLLTHFSSVINEKTFNIVNSYVELCTNLNESFASSTNNSSTRSSFEDVCASLSSECFLACLIDLNKSMWHIMINYKKFINAHDFKEQNDVQIDELNYDQTLIKQKLKYGLAKIWQEIENKLIILIRNHKLPIYSFDDFISMINIVRKMARIGCEFSNTKQSEQLEEMLKKATCEYFYRYHKTKMEEIKVFLETELWELIPMKQSFSVEQLHEFNFLKNKLSNHSTTSDDEDVSYFSLSVIESQETPFDKFMTHKKNDVHVPLDNGNQEGSDTEEHHDVRYCQEDTCDDYQFFRSCTFSTRFHSTFFSAFFICSTTIFTASTCSLLVMVKSNRHSTQCRPT